jgi:hypothetical protein
MLSVRGGLINPSQRIRPSAKLIAAFISSGGATCNYRGKKASQASQWGGHSPAARCKNRIIFGTQIIIGRSNRISFFPKPNVVANASPISDGNLVNEFKNRCAGVIAPLSPTWNYGETERVIRQLLVAVPINCTILSVPGM